MAKPQDEKNFHHTYYNCVKVKLNWRPRQCSFKFHCTMRNSHFEARRVNFHFQLTGLNRPRASPAKPQPPRCREAQGHIQLWDWDQCKRELALEPSLQAGPQPQPQPQAAAPSAQKQCKRLIFCASLFKSIRILYPCLEDLCHKVILVFFRSHTISHNVVPDFSVVVAVCL